MKWFVRIYIGIVLVYIISETSTMALSPKPPSDRCILIKAHVDGRDDIATLVNMGLDIWEFQQDGVVIRVTDDERNRINESGFIIEIITEDVYEYIETISKKQFSLLAEPTEAKYHSHEEVIANLKALEDSGVAKTYIIGSTLEGRDICAVRISDNPSEDEDEPAALFLGCHHAREWISVEVPLYIAQYLVDNYENDTEIRHLIDNCQIWIVPVVNPDGYEYSRTANRMWVKNRRDNGDGTFGVDISCNYTHKWGHQNPRKNTSSLSYRGPSAFSEPETCAIRDLAIAYDFRVMMSYHSFGQMTLYPWFFTMDPCPDDIQMGAMSFKMRELIKETSGAIYIDWWDWPDGWVSSGGMETDWCFGELGVYSFVIELPPITFEEGGFRLPENQIIPTCEENLPVALYLISYAAADNGIENLTTDQTYSNIQLAINDANDGDEIVVNPGIYHESISFIDKNLTLRSKDPNDPNVVAVTVINIEDQYQGPVITISGSKNGGCLLYGLKITGGQVGISCCDASPTIKNCFIESNGSNAIEFWEFFEPPAIIDSNIIGQVAEVYHPALIAYWKLDEEQGIIAYDSAADCNGTLIGDPVWQPDGGMVDGALQFDGIDDHVITNYVLDPADGPFSVFAWVKGGAPGQIIISQADVTGSSVTWLGLDALGGKLMTDLRPPGSRSPKPPLVSEFVVTDGAWYHVGFVWDGSYRSLYVDDVEVAKDEAALDPLKSATDNLYFGTCKTPDAGTFFSGLIDDVRIYRFYNVALSSE